MGLSDVAHAKNGNGGGNGGGKGGSQPTQVLCSDSALFLLYKPTVSCQGPISGNDSESAVQALLGSEWEFLAKDDDGNGINEWGSDFANVDYFELTGGTGTSGTWEFDTNLIPATVEEFAIAIKGGPTYSLYKFEDLSVTSGDWDTLGVTNGDGKAGPGLSHFSVYVKRVPEVPVPTIPEPAAMVGLVAVGAGVVINRRKKA